MGSSDYLRGIKKVKPPEERRNYNPLESIIRSREAGEKTRNNYYNDIAAYKEKLKSDQIQNTKERV